MRRFLVIGGSIAAALNLWIVAHDLGCGRADARTALTFAVAGFCLSIAIRNAREA